jgi:hypothetical protein
MKVRFHTSFYHPKYGMFDKDSVYEVPEDVKLPKTGITIIDGKKEKLEEGEKPQTPRVAQPTKAEQQRKPAKKVSA